jgi:hypothetical protein
MAAERLGERTTAKRSSTAVATLLTFLSTRAGGSHEPFFDLPIGNFDFHASTVELF